MPKQQPPGSAGNFPRATVSAFAGGLAVILVCLGIALRRPSPTSAGTVPRGDESAESIVVVDADTNEVFEVDIDKATEHLLKGNEFLYAGKFDDAVREFRISVRYNPEDEDVYYNLALALAQKGDIAGAKTNYLKSLEIFPDYVEAHNNLGNLLVREGNFDEGIKHFQTALANDPESATAHNNLGNALARQKKTPESILHFEEAVRLRPDYPEAQFNLGNAYLIVGRAEEAAQQFTLLLTVHPDFPRARELLQRAKALIQSQGKQ